MSWRRSDLRDGATQAGAPALGTAEDSGVYLRKHERPQSESSFKRVLERAGLTQPRRRRVRAAQAGRLWSGQRAQAPNEVWTVDFKGWWYDVEWASVRTIDGAGRTQPLCVGVAADGRRADRDGTGIVSSGCLNGMDCREPSVVTTAAPLRMVRGLLGLSRLSAWWVALGIDLERGRPGHPRTMGGMNDCNRDIRTELEPGTAQQEALDLCGRNLTTNVPMKLWG